MSSPIKRQIFAKFDRGPVLQREKKKQKTLKGGGVIITKVTFLICPHGLIVATDKRGSVITLMKGLPASPLICPNFRTRGITQEMAKPIPLSLLVFVKGTPLIILLPNGSEIPSSVQVTSTRQYYSEKQKLLKRHKLIWIAVHFIRRIVATGCIWWGNTDVTKPDIL